MLTNDELKKKIIDIIHDTEICPIENDCDTCKYRQELMNYKDMSCRTLRAADNLIASGIGDVKEAELERKAYEVASNQYRIWFEEQQDRAKVAERALVMACANMVKDEKSDVNVEHIIRVLYYKYLKQAEKELAEVSNDSKNQ